MCSIGMQSQLTRREPHRQLERRLASHWQACALPAPSSTSPNTASVESTRRSATTHNTPDFEQFDGIVLEDWIEDER